MVGIEEVEVMGGSTSVDDYVGVTHLKETSSKQQEHMLKKKHKNLWMQKCISAWWKKHKQ